MKICYLVLVYNNIKDTIETLESIRKQTLKEIDILVVDNNSNEEAVTAVKNYSVVNNIEYIHRSVNDGYAGGNNYGFKLLKDKYDYIFVVNNYIILNDKYLTQKLLQLLDSDEKIAIAGPRVLVENNEDIPESSLNNFFFYRLQHGKYKSYNNYKEKHAIIGCFLAVKTKCIEDDFLFDDSLFMYGEELDLCLRVQQKGYKVVQIVEKSCSIYHKGGYSSYSRGKPWVYYLSIRNALLSARRISLLLRFLYIGLYFFSFKKIYFKLKNREVYKNALRKGFYKGLKFLLTNAKYERIKNDSEIALQKYRGGALIISMHPAPYRNPVFSVLEKKVVVDFLNLYETDKGHTEWEYEKACQTVKYKKFPIIGDVHFGLNKIVQNYETILIPGWFPITLLSLLRYCLRKNKKIVFSCDTVSCSTNLFHKYIFSLLRKCHSFFVPGKRTKEFLENKVGISYQKIFQGSYMIDETDWNNKVKGLSSLRQENRNKLNISEDDFVLLFVGKFVKNRDIPLLLKSVKRARSVNDKIKCIVIGNGAFYKENMLECIKNDEGVFIYYEKVSYEELSKFYSISDCYIHPGDEPYSLATVQAVTAGLPVISHENVGCLADYVIDGNNGIIIKEKDSSQFCNAILNVFANKQKYSKNAEIACNHYLKERNIKYAVEQLEKALNC